MSPRIRLSVFVFVSPPVGLGRGAQPKVDQGERLSEPKASSSSTPLSASTAGCPQRSGGTQTIGSPFFSLGFFGEAKKSKSPAGARPGLKEDPLKRKLAQAQQVSQSRTEEAQAYRLLRKLFFISLSSGCSVGLPMRNATQVARMSMIIRCSRRDTMGL